MRKIKNKKVREVVETAGKPSDFDKLGSYTGNPKIKKTRPQQDADDL